MSRIVGFVAFALVVIAFVCWVLHLCGYPLSDCRPTVDWDRWKAWKARLRHPGSHRPGSRPGSRFADLEVRAPLHHKTQPLTADQIARVLAEGRRDEDGAS